ncbi:MAG: CPBP family intramembrane metalloprotease [Oscillospiraceae bacterium]|nr:CPBP family intramembrane metalloprotease [Oscillospiraceae bacterium]
MAERRAEKKQKMRNTLLAPILTAFVALLLILSNFLDSEMLRYQDNMYLSVVILHLLIFVLPCIFYCKLKGTGYVGKLNFKLFGPQKIVFLIFIFIAFICADMIFKLAQYSLNIYEPRLTHFDRYISSNISMLNTLYIVIAYAILPAIAEEFLFRGVMLTEYNDSGTGHINAAFLTALLYAMLYADFINFPIHFLNGIIFALTVYVTKSIFAPISLHLAYNLFVIFFEDYMMRLAAQASNLAFYVIIMLALVFIFSILAFGLAERIYYLYSIDIDEKPDPLSQGGALKRFSEAAISPSYLLCLILFFITVFGFKI